MSAGAFVRSRYAASYETTAIHPIRVQPETALASIGGTANAAPAGAISNPIQARVGGGRRQIGLQARSITLEAPTTGQPAGYAPGGITRIPALTEAFYNLAAKGVTCTYLGAAFQVVSRSAERVDGSSG